MSDSVTIWRVEHRLDAWADPWGRDLDGYVVHEQRIVRPTGDTEPVRQWTLRKRVPVYEAADGRRWLRVPPMDYAGSTLWRPTDGRDDGPGLWRDRPRRIGRAPRYVTRSGLPITDPDAVPVRVTVHGQRCPHCGATIEGRP